MIINENTYYFEPGNYALFQNILIQVDPAFSDFSNFKCNVAAFFCDYV